MSGVSIISKSDERFFPGVVALVRSVRRLFPGAPIFILDAGMTPRQASVLGEFGCRLIGMVPKFHPRSSTIAGTHYNSTIFALLSIGELDVGPFVHLDADVVVLDRFCEMVRLLGQHEFVGVPDHPALTLAENIGSDQEVEMVGALVGKVDPSSEALNAGIFGCSDIDLFRSMTSTMIAAYQSDLLLPLRDQSLLNIALAAHKPDLVRLPVHFNFRHHFRRAPEVRWSELRSEGTLAVPYYDGEAVAAVHFIGPNKPWMQDFDRSSDAYRVWSQFAQDNDQW